MEKLGRITLRCSCGSDQFAYPDDIQTHVKNDTADGLTIRCAACGLESNLGEAKRKAALSAQKTIADALRQGLK